MVAGKSLSNPENMAYLALLFSLLRPELQSFVKLDQSSVSPALAAISNPYNLTGTAFSGMPYGTNTNNVIDNLITSKEAMSMAANFDPLSQYLNWQPNAQFNGSGLAMILGEATRSGSMDSESGYSSADEMRSPLSTSSFETTSRNHTEDLSELGAVGYTPASDFDELLNSFENYVDLDSIVSKGNYDNPDFGQFDLSGYETKLEPDYFPNKLSSDNFLYSPEYKSSDEEINFQDSLDVEFENKFFDPYSIDFGNSFTNSSSEHPFGINGDLESALDLDSLASLDFELPPEILSPSGEDEQSNQVQSQLQQLINHPISARNDSGSHPNVPSTTSTSDSTLKTENIPLQVAESKVATGKPLKATKKSTATKTIKQEQIIPGVSEDTIANLPVSELNMFIENLPEEQTKFVRDIRRRTKNKEAARVCRKRKIDAIDTLDIELKKMKLEKQKVLKEKQTLLEETTQLKSKISELESSFFKSLEGNGRTMPFSEYSIIESNGATIYIGTNIAEKEEEQSS